jgi:hypothetical protein
MYGGKHYQIAYPKNQTRSLLQYLFMMIIDDGYQPVFLVYIIKNLESSKIYTDQVTKDLSRIEDTARLAHMGGNLK